MRYGFYLPTRGPTASRDGVLSLAREGERLGFHSAMIADHIVFPVNSDSHYPYTVDRKHPGGGDALETFSILGVVGGATERLRLVTSVLVLPYRNPVLTAKMVASLDVLCGGRVTLGIGVGWLKEEFTALGSPDFDRRGAVSDEWIAIFKQLWTTSPASFAGEFYQYENIRCEPFPLQKPHPPIWLGAVAEKAIERAAKMGFHFQVTGPTSSVEYYDACLEKAGRNPQEYNTAQLRWIHIAKSREQAWETAARSLHHTAECYAKWFSEANDIPGDDQQIVGMPSVDEMIAKQEFDMFGENAIVGTPEDARGMIADYLSRGRVTHLVCGMAFAGLAPHYIRSSMEMFAKDVIPAFRK